MSNLTSKFWYRLHLGKYREMEYLGRASYNTFIRFKTKNKSIDIYRVLRCCALLKIKIYWVMKLARLTRHQQISINDEGSIYSISLCKRND